MDFERCDANGTCAALMPDVFQIGEDGLLEQLSDAGRATTATTISKKSSSAARWERSPDHEHPLPAFDLFAPDASDHPGGGSEDAAVAVGPEGYAVLTSSSRPRFFATPAFGTPPCS